MVGADEHAAVRAQQEFRVDERAENRVTELGVEAPQPLSLRRCQAKARHFDELTLDSAERLFHSCGLCEH